ncbi:hypothetical protein ZWY2020_003628 [Hordeum vulgare]|nr:hypothetical protein ZWY2020_003628 [Hordeum vulgare]
MDEKKENLVLRSSSSIEKKEREENVVLPVLYAAELNHSSLLLRPKRGDGRSYQFGSLRPVSRRRQRTAVTRHPAGSRERRCAS